MNTIRKNWPLEKSTSLWLRRQKSPVLFQAMEPYIPSYTVSLWRNKFSILVWLSMINTEFILVIGAAIEARLQQEAVDLHLDPAPERGPHCPLAHQVVLIVLRPARAGEPGHVTPGVQLYVTSTSGHRGPGPTRHQSAVGDCSPPKSDQSNYKSTEHTHIVSFNT